MSPEEQSAENQRVLNNLILLGRAIEKVENNELKTTQDVHNWLYSNGFYGSEEHRLEMLHKAEQFDAAASNGEEWQK